MSTARSDHLGGIWVTVSEGDRQFRLLRVHHEHCHELGRLALAGIGSHIMAVAGQFREALTGLLDRHRSAVDLAPDRPLKNGGIYEGGSGIRVTRRVAARTVFDEHAQAIRAERVRIKTVFHLPLRPAQSCTR